MLAGCASTQAEPTTPTPPPPRAPAHLELSAAGDDLRLAFVDGNRAELLAATTATDGVALLPLVATLPADHQSPLPLRVTGDIVHSGLPEQVTPASDGALPELDGAWAAIAPHHWEHQGRHFFSAADPETFAEQWQPIAAWAPQQSLLQLRQGQTFAASETELGWTIALPGEPSEDFEDQLIAAFFDPGLTAYRNWHRRISSLETENRLGALSESYDRYRQPEDQPLVHAKRIFAYFCADVALPEPDSFATLESIDALLSLRQNHPELVAKLDQTLAFEGVPDLHECFEAAGLNLAADTFARHDEETLFRILGARFEGEHPEATVTGGRAPWRRGDVLQSVQGIPIANAEDLHWALRHIEGRSRFFVRVQRGERSVRLPLTFPTIDTEDTPEGVRFRFVPIEGRPLRLPFNGPNEAPANASP